MKIDYTRMPGPIDRKALRFHRQKDEHGLIFYSLGSSGMGVHLIEPEEDVGMTYDEMRADAKALAETHGPSVFTQNTQYLLGLSSLYSMAR